jgi:hypothetical protein
MIYTCVNELQVILNNFILLEVHACHTTELASTLYVNVREVKANMIC